MSDEPIDRPVYQRLVDMPTFLAWRDEVGQENLDRLIRDEIMEAMLADGVRVALWYAERMQNVIAVMGEWTTDDDEEEVA